MPRESARSRGRPAPGRCAHRAVLIDDDLVAGMKIAADNFDDVAIIETTDYVDLAQFSTFGNPYVCVPIGLGFRGV